MPEKRLRKRVRSDTSDAIHLSPLVWSGRKQCLDAPEPFEQRTCGGIGDPRNAPQHREPWRRLLTTSHWRRCALPSFLPNRKPMKPCGRIRRILRPDDGDPEIGDRQ